MNLDPVMTCLLHTKDVQHFNRLQGVTLGKHQKESLFGCKMHVDSTDRFCVMEHRKFMGAIESAVNTAKASSVTNKQSVTSTTNYLLSFLKFYAGGKPTTVTYEEIPKEPSYRPPMILMEEASNLEQFFVELDSLAGARSFKIADTLCITHRTHWHTQQAPLCMAK